MATSTPRQNPGSIRFATEPLNCWLDQCVLPRPGTRGIRQSWRLLATEVFSLMDVWQLIARDHAYLVHLIKESRFAFDTTPARDREEMLNGVLDELAAHTEALEASLYAPLHQLDRTRQLAEDLHHEHRKFIEQLDTLARSRQGSTVRQSSLALDDALIGQHLRRYTQELIPAARELLSPAQVDDAAHAFVRAKMRTLRARQHHRSGRLALSNVVLTGMACAIAASLGYLAGRSGSAKVVKDLEPHNRLEHDTTLLPSQSSASKLSGRIDRVRPAYLMSVGQS